MCNESNTPVTTDRMRNMIAFMRLNMHNYDNGGWSTDYLTRALDLFEEATRQIDAMRQQLEAEAVIQGAHRDTIAALNAKLDAVPVDAIAFCVDAADYTYDVMWSEAKAWLETQVTP